MNIRFLGTAASEGWPSLFCECEACKKARELGGKNLRTRQQMQIGDDMLLDFGPDTLHHALTYGIELSKVKKVLVSHAHSDHFYPEDIMKRTMNYSPVMSERELAVYGSGDVVKKGAEASEMVQKWDGYEKISFRKLEAFKWCVLGEGERVLPLPAIHDSSLECFVFVIEKEGKRIFYGCDSYIFPDETFDALKDLELDLAVLECTGLYIDIGHGHCGIKEMLEVKERMEKLGAITKKTEVYISHLCHSGAFKDGKAMSHDEIEKDLKKYNVKIAYDGLAIEL